MKRIRFLSLALFTLAIVAQTKPVEAGGGYDQWGYNYTAQSFDGYYDNFNKPPVPVTSGDSLQMKWNAAWLSKDKVAHEGLPSYLDSGAWLTNHIGWTDADGKHTYFVKIVAAKSSWSLVAGTWYDGTVPMGQEIWNEFYIAQEVESGSGLITKAPAGPGLGNN